MEVSADEDFSVFSASNVTLALKSKKCFSAKKEMLYCLRVRNAQHGFMVG